MSDMFVVLPHQLFKDTKHLKGKDVILWEHPQYFTKYKYNKKRIILHRASMKYYEDYLKKQKVNVQYVPFHSKFTFKSNGKYSMFDPIDKIQIPKQVTILDTSQTLLSIDDMEEYRKKTKSTIFNNFYMFFKKKLDILPNVKSTDKENRKKLPKNIKIPKIPKLSNTDMKYINEAKAYTTKYFSDNYGTIENFEFPVTHQSAEKFLSHFLMCKFSKYGDYQDAITSNVQEKYLFHSVLSTSLNNGLLVPNMVIDKAIKKNVPMNSLEGFIRQLFWREYQRYCYQYVSFSGNYFGHKKRLGNIWYTGETKVRPVDDCIKKAFSNGYLHHIERLMIVGNFMNLSEIRPKEGLRWFIEFSCDSYEWVMYQNVLDMVFFVTGGVTMRRPYASSSNYILKMSDYKKEDWCDTWDKKYDEFKKKHKQKLWKYRYYFGGLK